MKNKEQKEKKCKKCNGTGMIQDKPFFVFTVLTLKESEIDISQEQVCPKCKGTGLKPN